LVNNAASGRVYPGGSITIPDSGWQDCFNTNFFSGGAPDGRTFAGDAGAQKRCNRQHFFRSGTHSSEWRDDPLFVREGVQPPGTGWPNRPQASGDGFGCSTGLKNLRKAFSLHSEGKPNRLRGSDASPKRIDRSIRLGNRPFGSVRRIRIHELHGNGTAVVR
jgi:hypothetical protein